MQQFIITIVNTVKKHLHKHTDPRHAAEDNYSGNEFEEWITTSSHHLADQASDLKGGQKGSSDADDTKGYLPLALMVKHIPMVDVKTTQVIVSCAKLRAKMAEEALKRCFSNITNWEERRNEIVTKRCKQLNLHVFPFGWQALASAELGLSYAGEFVTRDGPLLYTVVDIAKACAEAGRSLSANESCSEKSEGGVYSSKEEACYMCLSLETLEYQCATLKKGITSVFVNPHLRRTKELLAEISIYFKHLKVKASILSGNQKGVQVQRTLEAWIDEEEESDQ